MGGSNKNEEKTFIVTVKKQKKSDMAGNGKLGGRKKNTAIS